jgi:hypothetical protein
VLNLVQALPQVEQMAEKMAAESGVVTLPTEEIASILQRNSALEAFQAKYNVQFTRETFMLDEPGTDGTFVLKPGGDDPLPPVGCIVKVNSYHGKSWMTVVTGTDEVVGTYTAIIVE